MSSTSFRHRGSKFINVQRHTKSCGPVAVANAIKWHGIETSYASVLDFCTGIRSYHPRIGMWPFQMIYTLKILQMKFRKHRKFSLEALDRILTDGGSLIFIYETIKRGSHAVFIDAMNDTHYRIWNKRKGTVPWTKKRHVLAAIKRSNRPGKMYAFAFSKSDKVKA